jgi:3-hydroxy-9,10-secoandrosta-1,3,5(10)-triene-9,17-dione monooxygenase
VRQLERHQVLDDIASSTDVLTTGEQESAELRRLAPSLVKHLREICVMRLMQPARYGGLEADPRVFSEAMFHISRQSSSAGWVTGVVGVHAWNLGLFDDRAQREVWGDDPDVWISSSYGPAGTAREVAGGYELTGRWGFSSGSDCCDWVFVGGMVTSGDGPPRYRHFLLPRGDYEVIDVWHPSGLVGTGSNDIVVQEMFVPGYRTLSVPETLERRVPGRDVNPGPLFAVPWFSMLLNAVVVPLLGMASAAVETAIGIHRAKFLANPAVVPGDLTLARLTEATASVEHARSFLLANVGDIYETVAGGHDPTLQQRMISQRDHIVAVGMAVAAVDKAYQSGGPRSIHGSHRLQQLWRDAHAGEHHAMNLPDAEMPNYARYLITGDPGQIPH